MMLKANKKLRDKKNEGKSISISCGSRMISRLKEKIEKGRSFRLRRQIKKEEDHLNKKSTKVILQKSAIPTTTTSTNPVTRHLSSKDSFSLGSWNTIVQPKDIDSVSSRRVIVQRAQKLSSDATFDCIIINADINSAAAAILVLDDEDAEEALTSKPEKRRSSLFTGVVPINEDDDDIVLLSSTSTSTNTTTSSLQTKKMARNQSMPSLEHDNLGTPRPDLDCGPLTSRSSLSLLTEYYHRLSMPRFFFSIPAADTSAVDDTWSSFPSDRAAGLALKATATRAANETADSGGISDSMSIAASLASI